jgi:hypothetical protein
MDPATHGRNIKLFAAALQDVPGLMPHRQTPYDDGHRQKDEPADCELVASSE